jgi:threonine dehydrogenase-like Zn-dependent dehydrogenase
VKALYYDGTGGLEWRDDPAPQIEVASDALVRPIAVSTCDLDQAIIHSREPLPGSERPFAIGHEGVGEVVDVGAAVSGVSPGEIVAICHHLSCGICDRCVDGHPEFCRTTTIEGPAVFGIPVGRDYGGLFSELIRVPFADYCLLGLPPNVSAIDAVSVGDNLTDAWRTIVPHLRRKPGADVLIMSTGSAGLYAADVARACGAGRVCYVDRDEQRLALARRFGAETRTLEDFEPHEHSYDIALNASESRTALRNALLATAPGGDCANMAFFFREVELPLLAMHLNGVHFCSSVANARVHMPEVLQLLSSGRISPQLVATGVLPFDAAADALPTAGFKPVFVREPVQVPAGEPAAGSAP